MIANCVDQRSKPLERCTRPTRMAWVVLCLLVFIGEANASARKPQDDKSAPVRQTLAKRLAKRDSDLKSYFFPFSKRTTHDGKLKSSTTGHLAGDEDGFSHLKRKYDENGQLKSTSRFSWNGAESTLLSERPGKKMVKVIGASVGNTKALMSPMTMMTRNANTPWSEILLDPRRSFELLGEKEIDGHLCTGIRMAFKIEGQDAFTAPTDIWIDGKETLIIWEFTRFLALDEAKKAGFFDTKGSFSWRNQTLIPWVTLKTKKARSYDNIWVPTKIEQTVNMTEYTDVQTMELDEEGIKINKPPTASVDEPDLPPGTRVVDHVRDRTFTIEQGQITDGDSKFLNTLAAVIEALGSDSIVPIARHLGLEEHSPRAGVILACCLALGVSTEIEALEDKIGEASDIKDLARKLSTENLFVRAINLRRSRSSSLTEAPMMAIISKGDASVTSPMLALPMRNNRVLAAFPLGRSTVMSGDKFCQNWTGRALVFAKSEAALNRTHSVILGDAPTRKKPKKRSKTRRRFLGLLVVVVVTTIIIRKRRPATPTGNGENS